MPSLDAVERSVREHASGALPPRVPSLLDDCANVLHRPRKARVGNRKLTLAAMVFAVAALAAVVVAGVLADRCRHGHGLRAEKPRALARAPLRHRLDGA